MVSIAESHSVSVPVVPWWWRPLVAYARRELPMWGRLYALCGADHDERFSKAGRAVVRGKLHGYRMAFDLSNASERLSYCLGRYHDLPLQLAMQRLLREGDTFVDVGANLGMLSLLACRLVGPRGLVIAVEPAEATGDRIAEMVARNELDRLRLERCALGAGPSRAELREFGGHSGWASLVPTPPGEGCAVSMRREVAVRSGDELLADVADRAPVSLKIDVEGYEVEVLRGFDRTLDEARPLVFLEVIEEHQRRAGHSLDELVEPLARRGYRGHYLWHRRTGLRGARLEILPLDGCRAPATDAVFVPPDGEWAERWRSVVR